MVKVHQIRLKPKKLNEAITRRNFLGATLGSVAAMPLFIQNAKVLRFPYVIGAGPFVMIDVQMNADIIVERMREKNVLVAGGKHWGMPTYIRISYGTDMDNLRAIRALWESVSESQIRREVG